MSKKEKILANCNKAPQSGCWEWNKSLDSRGYGRIMFHGKRHIASRASYMAFVGSIPEGRFVLHKCDNRKCVNPEHLYLGDAKDNARDAKERNRLAVGEAHTCAKIPDIAVLDIRNNPTSKPQMAKKYGVSYAQIWRIVNNQRRQAR